MMISITPKNWEKFQHYTKRTPPWIKLHRAILTDYKFSRLPLASKAIAPLLWLLSSESKDGSISIELNELAFRLSIKEKDICQGLIPLLYAEFFVDEDGMLAERLQDACRERERETEGEECIYGDVADATPAKKSSGLFIARDVPDEELLYASKTFGLGREDVIPIWEKFKSYHLNPDNKKDPKKWFFPWRSWIAEESKRKVDLRQKREPEKDTGINWSRII